MPVAAPPVRPVTVEEIRAARERIKNTIVHTPLVRLRHDAATPEIWLKLENLQPINAFKLRGAANAVALLAPEERQKGVWTISAGNAGQGVAFAAREAGVPVTVVTIETAPETKVERMRKLGARIVKAPFDACWNAMEAREFPGVEGTFIHPFDEHNFIAGNATLGLEIIEDLPGVKTVIAAIGGGGLISGIGSAIRQLAPHVRILGAEPETAAPGALSFERGSAQVFNDWQASFVDGAGGKSIFPRMWERMQGIVDGSIVVTLDEVRNAMRVVAEKSRVIAEGAGALAVAAALSGKAGDGPIVAVISGGNIDLRKFAELATGHYNQQMNRSTRRLLALAAGLVAFVILAALIYQFGMLKLEGQHRSFWRSLEWATETISTTGYGSDNQWSHPAMVILVVLMQFAGILLVPVIVSAVLVPFMEERFEQLLPRTAPAIDGHVVVYRYGPTVETLLQRLKHGGVLSLVLETDEDAARSVLDHGFPVVFSRAEEDALDLCRLGGARALVANGSDEQNASIVLRARQMGFQREVYALVEDPSHRKPMELAGATAVYTPRHIVAAALAAHASDRISPRLPGAESIPSIHRREIRVPASSPMAGKTLGQSRLGAESGAIVVGQWTRSRLHARCDASMRIEPGALLEMVGTDEALDQAAILIGGVYLRQSGPFVIGGFGEVGRKVHELLRDAGEEVRVVERHLGPGVDVVGDVLDSRVLEDAGMETARTVILALNSDDATLFATVIVRDAAPNVTVIARVNHSRNLDNIYRAGADYALSISDVSGEMLSARLLGRVARSREEHRQVVRVPIRAAAGRTVRDSDVRAHGCSLIAIDRGGAFVEVTADTTLAAGDQAYLCGNAESLKAASAGC